MPRVQKRIKRESKGKLEFIPHHRCARNDLLTADGQLELMIDVELLEEEVLPSKARIRKGETYGRSN